MSDLLNQIKDERKQARRSKDVFRAKVLTTLVGEAETALKGKQADKFDMLTLVKKFYSNLQDSLALKYTEEGHTELCILSEYIPTQLTEDDFKRIIVQELTADERVLGKFMQHMNKLYKGQFNGKLASDTFKAFKV